MSDSKREEIQRICINYCYSIIPDAHKQLSDAILAWHEKEIAPIKELYEKWKDENILVREKYIDEDIWESIRKVAEGK